MEGEYHLNVDYKFKWVMLIDYIFEKVRSWTYKLFHLKCVLPYNVLLLIYQYLCKSVVRSLRAWINASMTHFKKIENLQEQTLESMEHLNIRQLPRLHFWISLKL